MWTNPTNEEAIDQVGTTDWFKLLNGTKAFVQYQLHAPQRNCLYINKDKFWQRIRSKSGAIKRPGSRRGGEPHSH